MIFHPGDSCVLKCLGAEGKVSECLWETASLGMVKKWLKIMSVSTAKAETPLHASSWVYSPVGPGSVPTANLPRSR